MTPRSADLLDYTNFGELGEIIKVNWSLFSNTLSGIKAVEVTLARLNTLRAPIAHCSMLAEDEVMRLRPFAARLVPARRARRVDRRAH